ncbi:MAG: hypothetical protein SGCHY_002305 [Lobulomycetales sp.]
MRLLGEFYAKALLDAKVDYTVLFGPAYKGIPLVTAAAIALSVNDPTTAAPFAFNRKEAKNHGEGGCIVGADLAGQCVFVVDDVITAGTAIRESVALIHASGATFSGVIVALDRQEKVSQELQTSAIAHVRTEFGVPVVAIVAFEHVLEYLKEDEQYSTYIPLMETYRSQYGSQ